ncbi:hypothetical protein FIBSPDRAFT_848082, partial [Athelia psychrophila]
WSSGRWSLWYFYSHTPTFAAPRRTLGSAARSRSARTSTPARCAGTPSRCSPPRTWQRATGNGIAIAFDRLMGIVSAVITTEANTDTSMPIYICAALYGAIAVVAIALPFEPYGRRSS